jgi:hypothetical protein
LVLSLGRFAAFLAAPIRADNTDTIAITAQNTVLPITVIDCFMGRIFKNWFFFLKSVVRRRWFFLL